MRKERRNEKKKKKKKKKDRRVMRLKGAISLLIFTANTVLVCRSSVTAIAIAICNACCGKKHNIREDSRQKCHPQPPSVSPIRTRSLR